MNSTKYPLLLASQSPRRREMITWLGLVAQTTTTDIDETPQPGEMPATLATRLARAKARAAQGNVPMQWILAADTIVDLAHRPLGKPQDQDEARSMLWQLRPRPHAVHTGVALYNPASGESLVRCVTTRVMMRDYTINEIQAYVDSGDPMDKAGAYAIQNSTFHPVSSVERCYANVVGFPFCAIASLLRAWKVAVDTTIPELCARHFGYACPAIDEGTRL